jgi:hypothetical protein
MNNPRNPNNREDNLINEKASSYGDGYVDGRVSGTNLKNEALEARDQANSAGGLVLGLIIASLLGLGGLAYYLWGRTPAPNSVIVVPGPASSQQPSKQTTIIEKTNTIERVPAPAAAPTPQQTAPNVNLRVNVPQPQAPKTDKTNATSGTAPAQQNTTINVVPPQSSTNTSTSASSPDASSKTQTPNASTSDTNKSGSDTGTTTNSNP